MSVYTPNLCDTKPHIWQKRLRTWGWDANPLHQSRSTDNIFTNVLQKNWKHKLLQFLIHSGVPHNFIHYNLIIKKVFKKLSKSHNFLIKSLQTKFQQKLLNSSLKFIKKNCYDTVHFIPVASCGFSTGKDLCIIPGD